MKNEEPLGTYRRYPAGGKPETQCELRRGNSEMVSWIPSKWAIVGHVLPDGWRVTATYSRRGGMQADELLSGPSSRPGARPDDRNLRARNSDVVLAPPGFSALDWFMEGIVGSAWTIVPHIDPVRQTVAFRRLPEESEHPTYVSPNRRHLYSFDGTFYRPKS